MFDMCGLPTDVLARIIAMCGVQRSPASVCGLPGVNGLVPGGKVLALEELIRLRSVNRALRAFLTDPQTTLVLLGRAKTFFLPRVNIDGVSPMPETLVPLFWMPKDGGASATVLFHAGTPEAIVLATQEQILGYVSLDDERTPPVFLRQFGARQFRWRNQSREPASQQQDSGSVTGRDGRGLKRASEEGGDSGRQKVVVVFDVDVDVVDERIVGQITAEGTRALVLGQPTEKSIVVQRLNDYLSTAKENGGLAICVAPPLSPHCVANASNTVRYGEYPRIDALVFSGTTDSPFDLDPKEEVAAVARAPGTLSFFGIEGARLHGADGNPAACRTNYARMLASLRNAEHVVFHDVTPPHGATRFDVLFLAKRLQKASITFSDHHNTYGATRDVFKFVSRVLYLFDHMVSASETIGETAAVALIASYFRYGDDGNAILTYRQAVKSAKKHAGDPRLAHVLQMAPELTSLELSVCFNSADSAQAKHALSAVLDLLKLIGPLSKLEELSLELMPWPVRDDQASRANALATIVAALGKQDSLPLTLRRLRVEGNYPVSEDEAVTLMRMASPPSVKELDLRVSPPLGVSFLPALKGKTSAVITETLAQDVAADKTRLQEAMISVQNKLLDIPMPPSSYWSVLFCTLDATRFFVGELYVLCDSFGHRESYVIHISVTE